MLPGVHIVTTNDLKPGKSYDDTCVVLIVFDGCKYRSCIANAGRVAKHVGTSESKSRIEQDGRLHQRNKSCELFDTPGAQIKRGQKRQCRRTLDVCGQCFGYI